MNQERMDNSLDNAKILLAQAAQHEIGEIPDDASLTSWSGWDSLVHMRLILSMEAQLGHELPAEAIINISSLAEVARYLSE